MSYLLIGLLLWIAPALLLGCALLWVRFIASSPLRTPCEHVRAGDTEHKEEVQPQMTAMDAAE